MNIIKNIFDIFGFTIVSNTEYNHLEWEKNHWKTAYDECLKREDEYHDFVKNTVFKGWNDTIENNNKIISNYHELSELCDKWSEHYNTLEQFHNNTISEKDELFDKLLNETQMILNILNELTEDNEEIKNTIPVISDYQKIVKEGYRHQLADMGKAIDRLMGEMIASGKYTEEDFDNILGYDNDSYTPGVSLYNQIQQYLPSFDWKYKEI